MSESEALDSPDGIPSIAVLRRQTMAAKPDGRWWYRLFRGISVYLTWLLLHTRVTPNQVTVASLVAAMVGLVLLGTNSVGVAIAGVGVLTFYHLLDRVDGEVARARRLFSLRGIYLDNAGHFISDAGIFVALTYRLSATVSHPRDLWLIGAVGGLAAALTRTAKHAPFQLFAQYVMERPSLVPQEPAKPVRTELTREATKAERSAGVEPRRTLVGMARSLVLTWTSFPATLLLITVGLVVEIISGETDALVWLLILASASRVVVYLAVEAANLTGNLSAETRRLSGLK